MSNANPQPKPPFEVHTFNVSGEFIERQAFNISDLEVAETIARNYSEEHSGFAQILDANGNVVIYEMNQPRAQEVPSGLLQTEEVSKVPYSIFMQQPSGDLPQDGVETTYYRASREDLQKTCAEVQNLLGPEVAAMVKAAFGRAGYYRFELLVGSTSLKIYKHPSAK